MNTAPIAWTFYGEMDGPPGAAVVGLLSRPGAFVLGRFFMRHYKTVLRLRKLSKPTRHKGKVYQYRLEWWEDDVKSTVKNPLQIRPVRFGWLPAKTDAEAEALCQEQAKLMLQYENGLQKFCKRPPPTEQEKCIRNAQLKVLAKSYPVTVRLFRQIESRSRLAVKIKQQATASFDSESERRAVAAWTVETEKLIGKKLDDVSVADSWRTDLELAEVIADAIKRKAKGWDAVDYMLAANWPDYTNKTAKQYANEIADATKQPFTKAFLAMVTKRRQRLELPTQRQPGPPERAPA